MNKVLKYLSFGSMAVLILMMMAATILEKLYGTPFAFRWIYHHPLFIVLWAVAAVAGGCYLLSRGVARRFFTLTLHLSFVIILAGALVTHLTGKEGMIHLRVGEPAGTYLDENDHERSLPFQLRLENFAVDYYTGSKAPADFRSELTVLPDEEKLTISMNHIGKVAGYRLYQADFDKDLQGSVLAVSHDPWGTGLTYAGYLLLLVSMLGFFFQKGTHFRAVLARVMQASVVVLCLFLGGTAEAKKTGDDIPKAVPREVADAFGDLYVYYNDRICPMETLTRDYTLKAYGKSHWKGYDANQVVSGWLFYYDWWKAVPFKVKAKDRGTARESEKTFLQRSAASGDALKIYPVADSLGTVTWYNCSEPLPDEVMADYDQWVFIRKVMDLVDESVKAENWDEAVRILGKIKAYQEKTAAAVLPSPARVKAERLYNRISRPRVPFMASITLGMILFILSGIWLSKGKKTPKRLQTALAVLSALLFLYLTLVLGLRWYVSGHVPFVGSYCVMMLIAWMASLAMLLLYRKFPLIQPLGFLLAGFTMLMASMAGANPRITHLMPVLQSPLLSIHVLSMMISYTLFGLVALNGVMGVIVPGREAKEKLRDVSLLILYPAVFIITFGTFLGAVWANISWGSYWAWDPKETWALITLLIYAAALHGSSLKAFQNPKFFHWFTIFALLSVIITYFGVNLLLGGMHSYA